MARWNLSDWSRVSFPLAHTIIMCLVAGFPFRRGAGLCPSVRKQVKDGIQLGIVCAATPIYWETTRRLWHDLPTHPTFDYPLNGLGEKSTLRFSISSSITPK